MCYSKLITALLFLFASNFSLAQNKLEKESRIKTKNVPPKALAFTEALNFKTRIKWLLEEGLEKTSIEGKFKHKNTKYSLEFDTLGRVEDLEVEVAWGDLAPGLRDSITAQFRKNCSKHKIIKIQRQFTGPESELIGLLNTGNVAETLRVKYEIVVRCHQSKQVDLFEYLLSHEGEVLSTSKIVFKNSNHLEY